MNCGNCSNCGHFDNPSETETCLSCDKEYTRFKVGDLRNILAKRGLSKTGTKSELIARLQENDATIDKAKGIWTINVNDMFTYTTLKIDKTSTGSQFKQELSVKRGVPVERLILSYNVGDKSIPLQDDQSLEAQGINDGYYFNLRIKLR